MMPSEKRELVQSTIVELHRAIKALKALDEGMRTNGHLINVNAVIRGQAKRASMDATRALAKYRKMPVW